MARWNESDLKKIKEKGLVVQEQIKEKETSAPAPAPAKKKIEKVSVEKNTIGFILIELKQNGIIKDFKTELIFDAFRKFRFDWAIPEFKIAIEYEGIFSTKSRHTTLIGYTEDCNKYNLALINGWQVLRYTSANYQNMKEDLLKLISKKSE